MTDAKVPPYRRKRPQAPKAHANPPAHPSMLASFGEAVATFEAEIGSGRQTGSSQSGEPLLELSFPPLPELTVSQREQIAALCASYEIASDAVPTVEAALRLSKAIEQSSARRARSARGRKVFDELRRTALAFADALQATEERGLVRVLGASRFTEVVGPDLSGIERWQTIRLMQKFIACIAEGASTVAETTKGNAGAPSTPEFLLVAIELLAEIWEKYGAMKLDALKVGKLVAPRAAQNRKGGQFHAWTRALIADCTRLATAAQVNTAIGQVVADRKSRSEHAAAQLG